MKHTNNSQGGAHIYIYIYIYIYCAGITRGPGPRGAKREKLKSRKGTPRAWNLKTRKLKKSKSEPGHRTIRKVGKSKSQPWTFRLFELPVATPADPGSSRPVTPYSIMRINANRPADPPRVVCPAGPPGVVRPAECLLLNHVSSCYIMFIGIKSMLDQCYRVRSCPIMSYRVEPF